MQTVGPYRLLQALGTCQVGGVWSATDAMNNQVTVAVLNANAGQDPGWRSAFAAAANGLAQAGRLPVVTADHNAPTPWVAVAGTDGSVAAQVFVTLGMSYQPVAPEPGGPAAPGLGGPGDPAAHSEEPTQVTGVSAEEPTQVSGTGWSSPEPEPDADPTEPVSGSARVLPQLVSAPPHSPPQDDAPTGETPVVEPNAMPPTIVPPPPPEPPPPGLASPGPPPAAVPPPPVSGPPASGPPASGPPFSGPPQQPFPPQPASGMPSPTVPAASPYDLYAPSSAYTERSRRRTWLVIGAVLIGLVVLGGGGGAIALVVLPDDEQTDPPPPAPSVIATTPAEPAEPGIEPPADGEWPADWPTFEEGAATPITNLDGVGFSFEVPEGWSCTPAATSEEEAHYTCGPGGNGDLVGGDLIVRTCPDPCDADRRVEMRRAEEAWGLQWVRDSGYRSWAETEEIDGASRYGLVLVGYWRSTPEGRIDQQVVFRMSAPLEQTDEIRMVGGSVRGAIHELTPG